MPNWCFVDIDFSSKKSWKLHKIIDKLLSNSNKADSYGNMKNFDVIYSMKYIVMDWCKLSEDEFDNIMRFMYKNLLDSRRKYLIIRDQQSIMDYIEYVKGVMDGSELEPYETTPELVRMKSIIKPNEMAKYHDTLPIETLLPRKDNKELYEKFDIPESYWTWTYDKLGVKWDIDSYSNTPEIFFSETDKLYHLHITGQTAWTYPNNFICRVCKKYKIKANVKYSEEGMVFAGIYSVSKRGKIKKEEFIDEDEFFHINSCRVIEELSDIEILDDEIDIYNDAVNSEDEDYLEEMENRLKYLMDTTKDYDVKVCIRKKLKINKKIFRKKDK